VVFALAIWKTVSVFPAFVQEYCLSCEITVGWMNVPRDGSTYVRRLLPVWPCRSTKEWLCMLDRL